MASTIQLAGGGLKLGDSKIVFGRNEANNRASSVTVTIPKGHYLLSIGQVWIYGGMSTVALGPSFDKMDESHVTVSDGFAYKSRKTITGVDPDRGGREFNMMWLYDVQSGSDQTVTFTRKGDGSGSYTARIFAVLQEVK